MQINSRRFCSSLGRNSSIMLAVSILCSACTFTQSYPDDWAPIAIDDADCPDISGTYKNSGLPSFLDSSSLSDKRKLSEIFLGESLSAGSRITIGQLSDGMLQVQVLNDGNKIPKSRTLSRDSGDFECEDGKIWLWSAGTTGAESTSGAPTTGKGITQWIGLAKAEDDSLVGKDVDLNGGDLLFFTSFYNSYIRWQGVNATFAADGTTQIEVPIYPRNVDKRQLYDVERCTVYLYTVNDSIFARLSIDYTRFAEMTLTNSDYGRLTLDNGVYSIITTFSDGSGEEFELDCRQSEFHSFGRQIWPGWPYFLLLYKDGTKYVTVVQESPTAIRHFENEG